MDSRFLFVVCSQSFEIFVAQKPISCVETPLIHVLLPYTLLLRCEHHKSPDIIHQRSHCSPQPKSIMYSFGGPLLHSFIHRRFATLKPWKQNFWGQHKKHEPSPERWHWCCDKFHTCSVVTLQELHVVDFTVVIPLSLLEVIFIIMKLDHHWKAKCILHTPRNLQWYIILQMHCLTAVWIQEIAEWATFNFSKALNLTRTSSTPEQYVRATTINRTRDLSERFRTPDSVLKKRCDIGLWRPQIQRPAAHTFFHKQRFSTSKSFLNRKVQKKWKSASAPVLSSKRWCGGCPCVVPVQERNAKFWNQAIEKFVKTKLRWDETRQRRSAQQWPAVGRKVKHNHTLLPRQECKR